jgi:SET domain-containing protein
LQPSPLSGVGVFAIREIPPGVNPFVGMHDEEWLTFTMDELDDLHPEIKKMIDDFFVIETDGTVRIPASGLNGMDTSFYVNNSDHPNLETNDGFLFTTMRSIKPGEELTVAYSSYDEKYA